MLSKLRKIFLILVLSISSTAVWGQNIAQKNFTKINSPVFLVEGFSNLSTSYHNEKAENFSALGNDTQIFLKSGVMAANHNKYGLIAKAEFNYNSRSLREDPNLDQAFFFAETDFGKFEVGNNVAVNQKMKVGAAKIARGSGGINGKYLEGLKIPRISDSTAFILLAQSPIGHGGYARGSYLAGNGSSLNQKNNFRAFKDNSFDGLEDATKLSYYSPRIAGLQLGVSYAPNANNSGITSNHYFRQNNIGYVKDVFSFAANYVQDFDNLSVEISTTAEKGDVKDYNTQRHNLMAYDFGATISYFGFTFGASYGNWGKSLQQTNAFYSKASYYTTGLSYEIGPAAISITTLASNFQKNKYSANSLGLDYKLSKSFMPYFEVTRFSFKENQSSISSSYPVANNRGYIALTGILISF